MIHEGDMVRRGNGPPIKVVDIFRGMARCLQVDQHGRIKQVFVYLRELDPLWLSTGPRTLWPDAADLFEEQEAQPASGSTALRKKNKKSTKPRRSNKLKRGPGCQ
jgi:hypothetical protein